MGIVYHDAKLAHIVEIYYRLTVNLRLALPRNYAAAPIIGDNVCHEHPVAEPFGKERQRPVAHVAPHVGVSVPEENAETPQAVKESLVGGCFHYLRKPRHIDAVPLAFVKPEMGKIIFHFLAEARYDGSLLCRCEPIGSRQGTNCKNPKCKKTILLIIRCIISEVMSA